MEKDKLKLELLGKIIACEDAATLKRVEEILLSDTSEVKEGGENYATEADPVPAAHYQKLEEEFKKYKSGELTGTPWEKFREEIKSNYGF